MHSLPEASPPARLGPILRQVEIRPPRTWPALLLVGAIPMLLAVATLEQNRTTGGYAIAAVSAVLGIGVWLTAFLVRGYEVRTTLCERGIVHETFRFGRPRSEVALDWDEIEAFAHRAVDRFRRKKYLGSQAIFGLRGRRDAGTPMRLRRRIFYRRDARPAELELWLEAVRRWQDRKPPRKR